MTGNIADTFTKTEIFVNEIVFYGREEISLLGFLHDGGQFHETEYVITRNHLQELLSTNKKAGVETIWLIEQLFVYPHDVPATINLVEHFGTTQVFDAQEIVLEIPAFESPETLNSRQRGMLFVNGITPLAAKRKTYSNQ